MIIFLYHLRMDSFLIWRDRHRVSPLPNRKGNESKYDQVGGRKEGKKSKERISIIIFRIDECDHQKKFLAFSGNSSPPSKIHKIDIATNIPCIEEEEWLQ